MATRPDDAPPGTAVARTDVLGGFGVAGLLVLAVATLYFVSRPLGLVLLVAAVGTSLWRSFRPRSERERRAARMDRVLETLIVAFVVSLVVKWWMF